jgi:hypothetical protein
MKLLLEKMLRTDKILETTDDIIDHRVSQNVKYNNDKKSRPENFPARPLLMTVVIVQHERLV